VTLSQTEQVASDNVLAPNAIEEAQFYTNGTDLVCLMNARATQQPPSGAKGTILVWFWFRLWF
jgi:hypothetical protein